MARKQNAEQVVASELLAEFFAGNPECYALAYSKENLAAGIIGAARHGGWSEFAELLQTVQEFADLNVEELSAHMYVGAYTKFKQVGTMYERLMNEEYLRESANHSELTRDEVFTRMNGSHRQRAIVERGTLGAKFAATKTPKL